MPHRRRKRRRSQPEYPTPSVRFKPAEEDVIVVEPPAPGWTVDTLRVHFEALRAADRALTEERDRRYTEAADLRERALRVKDDGDRRALELAREIQSYKDEQHNNLVELVRSTQGTMATHADLTALTEKFEARLEPLAKYVTGQLSGPRAITGPMVASLFGLLVAVIAAINVIRGFG